MANRSRATQLPVAMPRPYDLLFRQVASDVAAHLGYTYPHDLDQRVTAYLHKMKRLV